MNTILMIMSTSLLVHQRQCLTTHPPQLFWCTELAISQEGTSWIGHRHRRSYSGRTVRRSTTKEGRGALSTTSMRTPSSRFNQANPALTNLTEPRETRRALHSLEDAAAVLAPNTSTLFQRSAAIHLSLQPGYSESSIPCSDLGASLRVADAALKNGF